MDKYEYKIRADEIKELIAREEYAQAAEIADTIDWRRVKSVMMLCTISDLYKINRRYEDARDMLLLAYERRPGGRTICYSLCELSIKMEEFVQAVEYYKEFVQVAPRDAGRYILQYKLYEAQDVGLEERIEVLEELKKRDYREKWAYELAYLYHRVGLATRCVEECDELILWFGDGKYVIKAMELKMLHQPLTPKQQEQYDRRFEEKDVYGQNAYGQASYDAGSYDQNSYDQSDYDQNVNMADGTAAYSQDAMEGNGYGDTQEYGMSDMAEPEALPEEELDIHVKTMDMGQYNTINLQEELAAGLREVLAGEEQNQAENLITRSIIAPMMENDDTESLDLPQIDEVSEDDLEPEKEEMEGTEVFFGETGEIGYSDEDAVPEETAVYEESAEEPVYGTTDMEISDMDISDEPAEDGVIVEELVSKPIYSNETMEEAEDLSGESTDTSEFSEEAVGTKEPAVENSTEEVAVDASDVDATADIVMEQMRRENTGGTAEAVILAEPPKALAGVLSMESDGQLSLVMPESELVEKQITGQMSLVDILAEWERMKKENEERRKEEVRQHVLEQTGNMFTEFEASVRDGLLEQIESGKVSVDDAVAASGMAENDVDDMADSDETDDGADDLEIIDTLEPDDFGEVEELEEIVDIIDMVTGEIDTKAVAALEAQGTPETAPEISADTVAAFVVPEDMAPTETAMAEPPLTEALLTEEPESHEVLEGYEVSENSEAYEEQPGNYEEPDAYQESESYEEPHDYEESENYEEPDSYGDSISFEEPGQMTEEISFEAYEVSEEGDDGEDDFAYRNMEYDSEGEPAPAADTIEDDMEEEFAYIVADTENVEETGELPAEEVNHAVEKPKLRALTKEEKELYAPFIQSRAGKEQIIRALDNITMAAFTGNVIITGENGTNTLGLAKNMIREIQITDGNFSGRVAKISGEALNRKKVNEVIAGLKNGALIIQKAADMEPHTVNTLYKALQQESIGLIVVLEGTKRAVNRFLSQYEELAECFTARVDIEPLSNDTLVAFGRQYALEREYSIDEFGVLALHTRIEEMQTSDHMVTVVEVKDIVDEAISRANKKTFGHFLDVLFARRYDSQDMIILGEKDFSNYI